MDSDSWSDRLASASRRYQLDFLSRSGELKKINYIVLCFRFDFILLAYINCTNDKETRKLLFLVVIKSILSENH